MADYETMSNSENKKSGFEKADNIVSRIYKYYSYIAVATMLVMGFLAVADILASKIGGSSIPITNDIIKYFMVPTCFCLLGTVQLSGGLMQVDIISRKYTTVMKKIFSVISNILATVVFGFAAWRSTVLALRYFRTGELSSMSSSGFVIWPLAAICALSLILLVIACIWSIFRAFLFPAEGGPKEQKGGETA